MFESLQQGMAGALKALSGKGKLTESNMREALALVETALLEPKARDRVTPAGATSRLRMSSAPPVLSISRGRPPW